MGHDITAVGVETGKEVYLRMSINDRTLISHFYHALDAQDLNGGLSGLMEKRKYSKEELEIIKQKYYYYKEEYLEPDNRGVDVTQDIIERIFSVRAVLPEENEIDFERLDTFFNEVEGEDFIIHFY